MKPLAGLLAAAAWLGVSLAAQPTAVPPGESLALVNASVVNVRDGRVTSGATIVMRVGRIESVGAGAPPAGVRTIPIRRLTTRIPLCRAGSQAASHSTQASGRNPFPGELAFVSSSSPRSP